MKTTQRPQSINRFALAVIISLLISACASPSSHRASNTVVHNNVQSLSIMEAAANNYAKRHNSNILVVFDIDDTLLESTNFFGGDTWFNWQRGTTVKHTSGHDVTIAAADEISCKFEKLGVFYELGRFKATETDAADLVVRLQSKFASMALTSRSPAYRSGTERELKRAGIDFSNFHLLPSPQTMSYNFNDGQHTRRVSYENGIVMSTGLNKGRVLQDILKKTKKRYSAIFFIDDGISNVRNMEAAWQNEKTTVDIFHYVGVEKIISDANMQKSRDASAALDRFLQVAFPDRYDDFSNDRCK